MSDDTLDKFNKHMDRQEKKSVFLMLDHMTCNRYMIITKEMPEYDREGKHTKGRMIRIPNDIWVMLHSTDNYVHEEGVNDLLSLLYEDLRK